MHTEHTEGNFLYTKTITMYLFNIHHKDSSRPNFLKQVKQKFHHSLEISKGLTMSSLAKGHPHGPARSENLEGHMQARHG